MRKTWATLLRSCPRRGLLRDSWYWLTCTLGLQNDLNQQEEIFAVTITSHLVSTCTVESTSLAASYFVLMFWVGVVNHSSCGRKMPSQHNRAVSETRLGLLQASPAQPSSEPAYVSEPVQYCDYYCGYFLSPWLFTGRSLSSAQQNLCVHVCFCTSGSVNSYRSIHALALGAGQRQGLALQCFHLHI